VRRSDGQLPLFLGQGWRGERTRGKKVPALANEKCKNSKFHLQTNYRKQAKE
jgi:hypothetical protein